MKYLFSVEYIHINAHEQSILHLPQFQCFCIHIMLSEFFWWLSPSPNFLSLNAMKLSPLFSFPFSVWDLTTLPQKNSNLWSLSIIVPFAFWLEETVWISPANKILFFSFSHRLKMISVPVSVRLHSLEVSSFTRTWRSKTACWFTRMSAWKDSISWTGMSILSSIFLYVFFGIVLHLSFKFLSAVYYPDGSFVLTDQISLYLLWLITVMT